MKTDILIKRDEAGFYVAEVLSLPGCLSQGKTRREAIRNIREAMRGWHEVMKSKQNGKPARQ